jgi:phosphoribosyl-AMP cyclohydrolase
LPQNAAALERDGREGHIAVTKSAFFPKPGTAADIESGTVFTPRFDADGLVPVVTTSAKTGEVLMLAYMNDEALALTLKTGEAHYWSRSRNKLWRKGEESGNAQRVVEIRTDCDQDAIWLKVELLGVEASCHTGRHSCFYRAVPLGDSSSGALPAMRFVEGEKLFDPEAVYGHAPAAREP